jgi:hypothetical protein
MDPMLFITINPAPLPTAKIAKSNQKSTSLITCDGVKSAVPRPTREADSFNKLFFSMLFSSGSLSTLLVDIGEGFVGLMPC